MYNDLPGEQGHRVTHTPSQFTPSHPPTPHSPPLPCCLLSQFTDQLQVAQWNGVTSEGHVTHDSTMLDLHHKLRGEKQNSLASFPAHHCLIPRPSCLIPSPSLPHSQPITVSFPGHHCLIPRASLPHSQTITVSFPGHHCLIPRPSLPHSQTITVSSTHLITYCKH